MRLNNYLLEYERTPMAAVEDPLGGSDPVPGTEEPATPEVTPPSDETLNADTRGTTPESVPYSRFKEVNDARRSLEEAVAPIAELEQLGYPVAELQRLVQWETEFAQDPVQAWLSTARSIENLPDAVKEAIAALDGAAPTTTPQSTEPPGSEPKPAEPAEVPEWAQKIIDREAAREQQEQEAAERAQAEAAKAAGAAALESITEAWKEMDEKDGIKTPEKTMLAHIISASRHTETPEEALAMARADWLATREETLTSVVSRPTLGVRPVPGSGSGHQPAQPPRPARTLKDASKLAKVTWGEQPVE